MKFAFAVLFAFAVPAYAETRATIEGRVTNQHLPLPGVSVTLTGTLQNVKTLTDVEGRYSFGNIPTGAYDIEAELLGLKKQRVPIVVDAGHVRVGDLDLVVETETETVTIACGPACSRDEAPVTQFDWPLCTDLYFNTTLIEAAQHGDVSAIALLERRYASTVSYLERQRIGAALLRRVPDDRAYWNELADHVNIAIRFPTIDDQPSDAFAQWCADRGLHPHDVTNRAYDALRNAASDARARPLLRQALDSKDNTLALLALISIAYLGDDSFLPAIEKTLARLDEDTATEGASSLYLMRSEAADRIAMKYLDEAELAEYREQRRLLVEEAPVQP